VGAAGAVSAAGGDARAEKVKLTSALEINSVDALLDIVVRQALLTDAGTVSELLLEAAAWLDARGIPMWRHDELQLERILSDVDRGLFFLALAGGEPAGTVKFQLETRSSGPTLPGMPLTFTVWSYGDISPAERFPWLFSDGRSSALQRWADAFFAWTARPRARDSEQCTKTSVFGITVTGRSAPSMSLAMSTQSKPC
jgi:hypothetical protein